MFEGYVEAVIAFFGRESWTLQMFLVVLATLSLDLFQKLTLDRLHRGLTATGNFWDDALVDAARTPLRVLIWLLGLSYAVDIAEAEQPAAIFGAVEPLRDLGVIILLAWFLVRFVRRAEAGYVEYRARQDDPVDRTTTDAIGKLLRASVVITAALVAMQTLGYSISGVLAFGGVGGIAVGFAAKDLLANFFGGLMIYLDRPFSVGDWVRSPDREIEGTVERIGWRLTVIRTFDKRPLYIPNSLFNQVVVENPSRMTNRRIYETVGIRYADAGRMADVVAAVRAMLETHAAIDTDKTLIVNFNAFAPSSLDFFVYAFTKTTQWVEFHAIKQDVLLKIIEIVEAHGASCAFPTSTVHLEVERGYDAAAAESPA
ncbi:MAG: mechanosensitive ion channel family protein [Gammaproteobacteria bacterium]